MTEQAPILHLVDDEESFRTALARFLGAAGYQVRTYASAEEFLRSEPGGARGCLILDVGLAGSSGLELQKTLSTLEMALPIVFVSGQSDIPHSVQALKAGAVDFLTKPIQHQELLAAVEAALARGAAWWATREARTTLRARYETLTVREREVLSHVVAGKLNKEIAADIGAAERTVKAHRAQVMEKMQASSVADLVRAYDRLWAGTDSPPSPPGRKD